MDTTAPAFTAASAGSLLTTLVALSVVSTVLGLTGSTAAVVRFVPTTGQPEVLIMMANGKSIFISNGSSTHNLAVLDEQMITIAGKQMPTHQLFLGAL